MIKKAGFFALVLCIILPISVSYADVSSDMTAELPLEQVIQNAIDNGLTIEQTVAQMLTASPDSATAIISAAVSAQPGSATSIAQAAITAGVDPAVVTSATAAPGNSENAPGQQTGENFPGNANPNQNAIDNRPVTTPAGGGGGISGN